MIRYSVASGIVPRFPKYMRHLVWRFVVRLTDTLMNRCLCVAWMQRVDLVMAVEGVLRTEEAGGLVDAIIGASEDSIVDWGFPFRNIVICPPNPIVD